MATQNTLTGLIPTLYAALNVVSREMVGLIPAVNRDSSAERAAVGQVVRSPIAAAGDLEDIVPGEQPKNSGGTTVEYADVTIEHSKAAPILWNGDADKGKTVYPSFTYTQVMPSAKKIELSNMAMGNTPTFQLKYLTQFKGKKALLELESVTSGKLGLFSTKNDDFSVPEIDFTAQTDDAGFKVGTLWIQE